MSLVVGLTFLQLDSTLQSLQYRVCEYLCCSGKTCADERSRRLLRYYSACPRPGADRAPVYHVADDVRQRIKLQDVLVHNLRFHPDAG
jgi:hypothetical protein